MIAVVTGFSRTRTALRSTGIIGCSFPDPAVRSVRLGITGRLRHFVVRTGLGFAITANGIAVITVFVLFPGMAV